MATPEWIDRAWALYRRHRAKSETPSGRFDDELWSDCVLAARRGGHYPRDLRVLR